MRAPIQRLLARVRPGLEAIGVGLVEAAELPVGCDPRRMSPSPVEEDVGMMRAVGETRFGDWMETWTGTRFYPLDARPEEVHAFDIAHSLARQNRYNGHIDLEHYSVAEHSVLMARWVLERYNDEELAFQTLMHDSPEAYISDMVRPLKRGMKAFVLAEQELWRLGIAPRWEGLLPELMHDLDPRIKEADNRILVDERAQVMRQSGNPWGIDHLEPLGVSIRGWRPRRAEQEFLMLYRYLLRELGRIDLA